MEFEVGEDLAARIEADRRAALVGRADDRQRRLRHAHPVFLMVVVAVAMNVEHQHFRQRVDHRHADAMQTAGDLVTTAAELTAGMQDRHDHFGCRAAFFLVDVDRNAATVVGDGDAAIELQGHGDLGAVPGKRFVDRIVDDFEHHVVQAGTVIGIADVHAGALAHGIETFQNLDRAGVVIAARDVILIRVRGVVLVRHVVVFFNWLIAPCSTWNIA